MAVFFFIAHEKGFNPKPAPILVSRVLLGGNREDDSTPNDPFPILERMEYCSLKVLSGPRWYRYIQTFRNLGLISSRGIASLRCPCPDVITSMHDKRDQITDSKNLVHNFLIIYFNDVTSSSRTGQNSQLRSRCRP